MKVAIVTLIKTIAIRYNPDMDLDTARAYVDGMAKDAADRSGADTAVVKTFNWKDPKYDEDWNKGLDFDI